MVKSLSLLHTLILLTLLLSSRSAIAFTPFTIDAIRIEGLQRIAAGTVFNYLPLRVGDTLDDRAGSRAIRALYRTGFFENVVLERDGESLVLFVEERPAIAAITLEGNEALPGEQLKASLKAMGLAEGRVFNPALLDKVEQELQREYLNLGRYNARVEASATPQERNRVALRIAIDEGEVATIHRINIVGNQRFEEAELLKRFQLGVRPWYSWFSDRDQYSKQRLAGDLEMLRSWYMDRGHINFAIDSTQVTITPDRQRVYITINITEGPVYHIGSVALAGDPILPEAELMALLSVKPGDIFSRREVTASSSRIADRLGDIGYALAHLNPIPEIDEAEQRVDLRYYIDPGNRIYVRRIGISGNLHTQDEVIRRELRQLESAWISTERVRRSKTRLDRLGFFDEVQVSTPSVAGTPDQVDVNYNVVERDAFGSLNFGIGYGDTQGLTLFGSITQENFLGTGKRVSLEVNTSDYNTIYSFSTTDPYYTADGVSRTLRAFFRETDPSEISLADYTTDSYGTSVSFNVPLSEYSAFNYGLEYEHTAIHFTDTTSQEIRDFCADNAELTACGFHALRVTSGWSHDTRNRAIFPDRGGLTSVTAELALPFTNDALSFWKGRLRHQHYLPLSDNITLLMKGELGYGDAYGETTQLPPFERFYAGGIRTVRGYRGNSLGPRDAITNDPIGGTARLLGNLELLFPAPFGEEQSKAARLSLFVDGGNVYDLQKSDLDMGELRYSAGMALVWMTPIGPLSFSIAKPLNAQSNDETEQFQFSLGTIY